MSTTIICCPPPNDLCAKLLQAILGFINRDKRQLGHSGIHGLKHRFPEQINGANGPGTDSWNNHERAIEEQQRGLKKRLQDYEKNRCGPPPPGAWEWATRRAPAPSEWRGPSTQTVQNAAKAAGAIAGLAVAGYVAYRVIRFLPSLAPPLWWSIPANLAIP